MAELEIELNLSGPLRKAMISSLADMIDALPTYRYAVILELLRRDTISRVMIAEAIGERALLERSLDAQNQKNVDAGMPEGSYSEKSWDEIAIRCIEIMQDTPGGRAEV